MSPFGSVALARAVVNDGSAAFVATVAVRSVLPIAFHTSVRADASSSAIPDTWGATVGVRPEKVTTASLGSTSTPAFFAAACTIAASFSSSGLGVIRPDSSAVRTTAGPNALASRPEVWAGLQLDFDMAQAMAKADEIKVRRITVPELAE